METPLDAFFRKLCETDLACAIVPGGPESCGADLYNGVVYLGRDLDPIQQGIVGLHELGHLHTLHAFEGVFRLVMPMEIKYNMELAAWEWARLHLPPGYESEFEDCREFGLSSYMRSVC